MSRGAILIAATCVVLLMGGVAPRVSAQAERFVLTGVVAVDGGGGVAWLQEPTHTQDKVVTARVGEKIGPYRVTKILEDQVEMEGPQGKFSVPLAGSSATARSQEPSQPSVPARPARASNAAAPVAPPAQAAGQSAPTQLPPHPALANPQAVVIDRGDPRREFPAAGYSMPPASTQVAQDPPAPRVAGSGADVPVAPSKQTGPYQQPPSPALSNPTAQVIPRGDPRRSFPTQVMLPGNR